MGHNSSVDELLHKHSTAVINVKRTNRNSIFLFFENNHKSHKEVLLFLTGESITDFPQNNLMPQVLKTEVEQLRRVMSETAQDGQTQQDFVKEHMSNQQIKLQLESNKTHNDELQKQLELLQAERAALQSNTSDIGQTASSVVQGTVDSTLFVVLIN